MAYQYVGGRPFLAAQGAAFTVVPQQLAGVPLTTPFRALGASQPMASSMMALASMDQAQLTQSNPLLMAGLPAHGGLIQAGPPQVKQEPIDALTLTANPYGAYAQYYDPQMMAAMGTLKQEVELEDKPRAVLDSFNSDLNLSIDPNGLEAQPLTEPMGFCFCWAGARATYGVISGKVCFEVYIAKNLPVDFGEEHKEQDPHVVRIGWSVDSASFQLGEVPESFGYGGTGMFSVNMRFSKYGKSYGEGDTIMALLDLESTPANMSFMKNGHQLGMAHRLSNWQIGIAAKALFPHILSKNARFEVNFGQQQPRYPPPPGYVFLDDLPMPWKVQGMEGPLRKSDCEMIMVVGLPGAGKTTFGIKMQSENPEKRYNIIGTDTLIDKMRVNGLPRKNNYHGRWEVLIQKATACLNTLFTIGSRQCRNYILDQTNVYVSARKRKLKNFEGFRRILAVVQPDDSEIKRREYKRTYEDGKFVPEEAVMEMKANFVLPSENEPFVDEIIWIELASQECSSLIKMYNEEGRQYKKAHGGGDKRPSSQQYGPPDKRGRYEGNALDYLQREYNDDLAGGHQSRRSDRSRHSSISSSSGYVSDRGFSHDEYQQDQWAASRPPSTWRTKPADHGDNGSEQDYGSFTSPPPWSKHSSDSISRDLGGASYAHVQSRSSHQSQVDYDSQRDSYNSLYDDQQLYYPKEEPDAIPAEVIYGQQAYSSAVFHSQPLVSGSLGQPTVVMTQPLAALAHHQGLTLGQPQAALEPHLAGLHTPVTALVSAPTAFAQQATMVQPSVTLARPHAAVGQHAFLGAPGVGLPGLRPPVAAMNAAGAPIMMTFGQPLSALPVVIQQPPPSIPDRPRKERKSRWQPAEEGQDKAEELPETSIPLEDYGLKQPPPPPPPHLPLGRQEGSPHLGLLNMRPGLMGPPPGAPSPQGAGLLGPPPRQATVETRDDNQGSNPDMQAARRSEVSSQNSTRGGYQHNDQPPKMSFSQPPPNFHDRDPQRLNRGPPFQGPPPPPPQGWGVDRGRGRGPRPPFRGGFGRGGLPFGQPGPFDGPVPGPPGPPGPPGNFQPRGWGGRGDGRGGMMPRGGPPRGPPRGMPGPPPRGMPGPPRGPFRPPFRGFRGH